MRPALGERVPAHMRDFQSRILWADAADLARDPAEPLGRLIFAAAFGHELHADADTEKRLAPPEYCFGKRFHHSRQAIEPAPAVREGADARQDHAIGPPDRFRIAGHADRLGVAALSRGALEGLRGRMQIA